MADDTRQSNTSPKEDLSREALTVDPHAQSFSGQQWQVQGGKRTPYQPPENANANAMAAGGSMNTAGGQIPDVTLYNALRVGQPITEIHKRPCVRDSLMTGIGAGVATGGVRAIFGAPIFKACNWAVGTFSLGSLVMYQWCMYQRQAEKEGMMRAVEILNKKKVEKRAREQRKEKAREERRLAKDRELDEKFATAGGEVGSGKPWWKVW